MKKNLYLKANLVFLSKTEEKKFEENLEKFDLALSFFLDYDFDNLEPYFFPFSLKNNYLREDIYVENNLDFKENFKKNSNFFKEKYFILEKEKDENF